MSGFRTPEQPRGQSVLWAYRLEDAIPSDHPVRLLDDLLPSDAFTDPFTAWADAYVLLEGKPPYPPRDLSGLYLYGMLNRIRSSRQLESACHNRLDLIWLMHGQKPDHSTIASFVRQHGKPLGKLFRDVVGLAVRAGRVGLDPLTVDGTKSEADAHGVLTAASVNDQPDDSGPLTPLVEQSLENGGQQPGAVSADSQYNTGPELASMEEKGIVRYLPDSGQNSKAAAASEETQQALARAEAGEVLSESEWGALPRNRQKQIDKSALVYHKTKDTFRCPAGQTLGYVNTRRDTKKGGTVERRQYGNPEACAGCAHAPVCCKDPKKGRLVSRDPYEAYRERVRERMATEVGRATYRRRKHTVEPRIGQVKHVWGVRRFMRRGLEAVRTEWSMVCTAVNIGILLRHWQEVAPIL